MEETLAENKSQAQPEVPNSEIVVNQTDENQENIHWRKFREKQKEERRRREEAERIASSKTEEAKVLKETLEAILAKTDQSSSSSEEVSEEERIARIARKTYEEAKKADEESLRKREIQEMPERLASSYPDIEQVLTHENIDYLKYHHPEIADACSSMPEGFQKYSNLYKIVKKLVPNIDSNKMIQRAERNLSRPQSASISGISTSDKPSIILTEERKAANWKRMQEAMKNAV